jgi:hypothetical protein
MDELAQLYAAALANDSVDYFKLTTAFALRGRITLMSTPPVIETADRALKFVVELALGPKRRPEEVRAMMDDGRMDMIGAFAASCRRELRELRLS